MEKKEEEVAKEESITLDQLALTIRQMRKSLARISMPADAHNEVQQVVSDYFKTSEKYHGS